MNTTLHRFLPTLAAILALSIGQTAANYADSSNIRVDTRGKNLVSLTVVPAADPVPTPAPGGPQPAPPPSSNTVPSGGTKQLSAWAFYDDGTSEDVTAQAKWSLGTGMPNDSEIEGGLLAVGESSISTQAQLSVAFFAGKKSVIGTYSVTIIPGPQIKVSASYESNQNGYRIVCTAQVEGAQQPVEWNDVQWDLDEDEIYGESGERGLEVTKSPVQFKSYLIRVKAIADGDVVFRSFIVNVKSFPVGGVPVTLDVEDITVDGMQVWYGGGLAYGGLAPEAFGLAVVIHGLQDSTDSEWVNNLCSAIQDRVPTANVAAWDWRLMADPSLYSHGFKVSSEATRLATLVSYGDRFIDLLSIRENGKTNGLLLAERLMEEYGAGRLSKSEPIHLIGHSAGGFVAGECALRLSWAGFTKLQVTMLDTPNPYHQQIKKGWRTERYVTSWFGGRFEEETGGMAKAQALYNSVVSNKLEKIVTVYGDGAINSVSSPDAWGGAYSNANSTAAMALGYDVSYGDSSSGGTGLPDANYRREEVIDSRLPSGATKRHSFAHTWYIETVSNEIDGFRYSNLLGSLPFPASASSIPLPQGGPEEMPPPDGPQEAPLPPVDLDGFTTFGTASVSGGVHTLTENSDAGFWKAMTMPIGSDTLRFRYRFTSAGDGDFLAAYWGDDVVLVIAPDTASARAGFVDMEADVSRFGGQQGNLVFKLVSRGEVNAMAAVDQIQIVLSDDPDGDGLTNTQEIALGSNPHSMDTDDDGLPDDDEANIHGTDPTQSDSDGDTVPDLAELVASTNPMDRTSALRPRMERGAGNQLELVWPGVTGRSYSVLRSLDLSGMSFDFMATGVPGNGGDSSLIDPDTLVNPRAFYWVLPE